MIESRRTSIPRYSAVLPLLLIALLTVQISTNIRLEAEESAGRLSDRAAFYIILVVAALLIATRELALVRLRVVFACILFFLYLLALVLFTTDARLLPYIVPNYGIVSWMLLGMACHFSIAGIAEKLAGVPSNSLWRHVQWVPALTLAWLVFGLRGYSATPGRILSYQFPAVNLIVLLLFGLLALDHWQVARGEPSKFLSSVPALAFLILGTMLTYYISLMNSTGIVVVWGLLALVLVWRFGFKEGWSTCLAFLGGLFVATELLRGSGLVEEYFSETRFGQLRSGSVLEFSSLTTRADLLRLFSPQFDVSPIFGHMEAEVVAGFSRGDYVHSLLLSALTHTGIVGTTILLSAVCFAAGFDIRSERRFFPLLLFALMAGYAIAFAFFTWIPFWFMLGYMAVRTRRIGGA